MALVQVLDRIQQRHRDADQYGDDQHHVEGAAGAGVVAKNDCEAAAAPAGLGVRIGCYEPLHQPPSAQAGSRSSAARVRR